MPTEHRQVNPHQAGLIGHVELPADPREGEPESHQKSIAEIIFCLRIGKTAAIEPGERAAIAAVRHFDERRAVRATVVLRPEQVHVRGEFHEAGCVAWRLVEIDDNAIVRVGGIDGEVDRA